MGNIAFVIGRGMAKLAAVPSEAISHFGYGHIPLLGSFLTLPGVATGLLSGAYTPEEQIGAAGAGLTNLIPSVGSHRMMRRLLTASQETQAPAESSGLASEVVGPITSSLLAAGLGAALGGLTSRSRRKGEAMMTGAGIGSTAGAAANLLGLLASALTKRRSREEMEKYDRSPQLLNWLVPGMGTYNLAKRLGYSKKYDEAARRLAVELRAARANRMREVGGRIAPA